MNVLNRQQSTLNNVDRLTTLEDIIRYGVNKTTSAILYNEVQNIAHLCEFYLNFARYFDVFAVQLFNCNDRSSIVGQVVSDRFDLVIWFKNTAASSH